MKKSITVRRFLLVSLIIFSASCAKVSHAQSDDHPNLKAAKLMIAATENKDIETLMSFFTEDAIFAQPFNPQGVDYAYSSKEAIRAGFEGIFKLIDTMSYKNKAFTPSNDGSVVFFEAQGDMQLSGSGKDYDNMYVFRVDFDKNGKVTKLTEYMNSLYLAKTFNVLKSGE
ncbi:MAG: nuclear transport factor 2 family protein [Cytophagales bacterium]|nr:nuclear transport factor 2 family protein [Cytophagales bacterium]